MSDLNLFSIDAGTAKQLPASSMALEKSFQTLIEDLERARPLLERSYEAN